MKNGVIFGAQMPHKNERVEVEFQILEVSRDARPVTNEEFLHITRAKIAEVELKLREIDE
jgi:hypothetical protein